MARHRRPVVGQTAPVTIFTRPRIARAAAKAVQRLSSLVESLLARRSRVRLPEFACDREVLTIPTSYGPARAWLYRPHPVIDTPPIHLNLHGGGFVLGLPEQDDGLCRALCSRAGAVVVNVDYVLAPQHPFPQPVEQAYEIACWLAGPGSAYGWDGTRLTVGGQSAGGSLAGATARLSLERGGPRIALQVLHYAPLDLTVPIREKTSAIAKPVLRPWLGELFDTCYLPDQQWAVDRLVSPASASDNADLTGIAPAVIIAAEYDVLLAEAARYAARLDRFGALVDDVVVAGQDHGYDADDDERARETYELIAKHVLAATGARRPGGRAFSRADLS